MREVHSLSHASLAAQQHAGLCGCVFCQLSRDRGSTGTHVATLQRDWRGSDNPCGVVGKVGRGFAQNLRTPPYVAHGGRSVLSGGHGGHIAGSAHAFLGSTPRPSSPASPPPVASFCLHPRLFRPHPRRTVEFLGMCVVVDNCRNCRF